VIVVLFSTTHREDFAEAEYRETSARMHEIVEAMPGFISYKEYEAEDGESVAVVPSRLRRRRSPRPSPGAS